MQEGLYGCTPGVGDYDVEKAEAEADESGGDAKRLVNGNEDTR